MNTFYHFFFRIYLYQILAILSGGVKKGLIFNSVTFRSFFNDRPFLNTSLSRYTAPLHPAECGQEFIKFSLHEEEPCVKFKNRI